MFCGVREPDAWPGLEVHEIERKSHAPKSWGNTANYLLLCQRCHAGVFATMPHAKQLAVKLIKDFEHFDLYEWLRIRDPELRAPERVTMDEVLSHLRMVD